MIACRRQGSRCQNNIGGTNEIASILMDDLCLMVARFLFLKGNIMLCANKLGNNYFSVATTETLVEMDLK